MKTTAKVVGFIILVPILMLQYGFVLSILWRWFVLPIADVPPLGI